MNKGVINKLNACWLLLIIVIYALIQGLIGVGILNYYYQITLITICLNIILAISLNLVIGVCGQFSLGHAGFMCVGAYVGALIVQSNPTIVGLIIGLVVGMIFSGLVSLIVAIPVLRLRGDYLAIATLGFAEIIRIIVQNMEITKGASGLTNIPKMTSFTIVYIALVLALIVIVNFGRSSHGRACIAIREDEIAAEAMGINLTRYKCTAFVIGAMIAAVAGTLYATYFRVIKPDIFSFNKSIDILVIVVFGGMGSMTGSIIAGIVLGLINMFLQPYAELRMIFYAISIVLIMIFRPQGLLGTKEFTFSGLRKKGGK
ncbi:MAG: branched-chain amino acid ABC transporter permease [Erysipelotrichales bacterium]|nr:branched-chain amino acid ABC transporter permease [Erysipelotrichales bacterium]